jgi:hypothetical protein
MVAAIGSSPVASVVQVGSTSGGIEAQIAQYKKELSGCVNCGSAKTPQGQAAIQSVAAKISVAEARLEKYRNEKASSQRPEPSRFAADSRNELTQGVAPAFDKYDVDSASRSTSNDSSTGNLVDVFAWSYSIFIMSRCAFPYVPEMLQLFPTLDAATPRT